MRKNGGFYRLSEIVGTKDRPGLIPVSKSTWWLWCKQDKAPAPIKLSPSTTVWRVEDVNRFIDQSARTRES